MSAWTGIWRRPGQRSWRRRAPGWGRWCTWRGSRRARERVAFRRVNALGTAALARAAAAGGVGRFLLLSSLAAQGPSLGGVPAAPGAARRPVSAYGLSKAEGEDAALLAGGEMVVQILRPPAVYGPGDRGLLPFFRMARRRYVVRMGGGANQVAMIYGPDLAEAIGALIAGPPGRSPFFHVSDAEGPYTWQDLIAALGGGLRAPGVAGAAAGGRLLAGGARQ